MRETRAKAEKLWQPSDLWQLESYLHERRKEIERKYECRYSILPLVFGILVREGRLREEEFEA